MKIILVTLCVMVTSISFGGAKDEFIKDTMKQCSVDQDTAKTPVVLLTGNP